MRWNFEEKIYHGREFIKGRENLRWNGASMGVAVQAGLLAAFIVVFLPLIMAGWHLTRNRLLFFSVSLFITLAASVHLLPYFPSLPAIFFSDRRNVDYAGPLNSSSITCTASLHQVDWKDSTSEDEASFSRNASDPCSMRRYWFWKPHASIACRFQKVNKSDALELLQGSWIMVAGDSQARLFLLSLMDLIIESVDSFKGELFKRHDSYTYVLKEHDIKLDFVWAPYVTNLTDLVEELKHNASYPDVFVMGNGLWHMLHVADVSEYFENLVKLQQAVQPIFPLTSYSDEAFSARPRVAHTMNVPRMFWLSIPTLISASLNTEEKRTKLTGEQCISYRKGVVASKLLHPQGPLTLLDLQHLSSQCGGICTQDGMHYCDAVYEATVQVMLNALLIATQQAPSDGAY